MVARYRNRNCYPDSVITKLIMTTCSEAGKLGGLKSSSKRLEGLTKAEISARMSELSLCRKCIKRKSSSAF